VDIRVSNLSLTLGLWGPFRRSAVIHNWNQSKIKTLQNPLAVVAMIII
jgi:hypothetical protein